MADRIAMAMSEGKLEEFMEKELPDNEYARSLAMMMLGMTGMASGRSSPASAATSSENEKGEAERAGESSQKPSDDHPPEDVMKAVRAGDVGELTALLEREHRRRTSDAGARSPEERPEEISGLSPVERETLNSLMKIASQNNLTMDWVVLRALRLYVDEYRKTGRL